METQNKKSMIDTIETLRQQLHKLVDRECDVFLLRLASEEPDVFNSERRYVQRTYLLHTPPSFFKGQRPASITFEDGRTFEVRTWKEAATVLLKECNADPVMHQRLLNLRGKISGRLHTILSDTPDEMGAPMEIDDGIYVEGKYDAETLMYVLTDRIFRAIGYDYSGIEITVRDPRQTYKHQEETRPEEEQSAPSMTMQM